MRLDFTCPNCHGNRLEEVMSNVTVSTIVLEVFEEGDCTYGDMSSEGGTGLDEIRYQCVDCGEALPNVTNPEDLWGYFE